MYSLQSDLGQNFLSTTTFPWISVSVLRSTTGSRGLKTGQAGGEGAGAIKDWSPPLGLLGAGLDDLEPLLFAITHNVAALFGSQGQTPRYSSSWDVSGEKWRKW